MLNSAAAWLGCLDSAACLPVTSTHQLWNYRVAESVTGIHRNFLISSFLLSQMVVFENREQNQEPYELWYFSLDFFLWTRGFSHQIWESQRSAKTYHNSPEEQPSLRTALPSSRVSWREPESIQISAVELEPITWNKHRVHVPQGNHSLQVVDGFGPQDEQTSKLLRRIGLRVRWWCRWAGSRPW